jgi:hypothetical protein
MFWNMPEATPVYKVKLSIMFRQLTTSYQATKLALEQPPDHGTEIQDCKYLENLCMVFTPDLKTSLRSGPVIP